MVTHGVELGGKEEGEAIDHLYLRSRAGLTADDSAPRKPILSASTDLGPNPEPETDYYAYDGGEKNYGEVGEVTPAAMRHGAGKAAETFSAEALNLLGKNPPQLQSVKPAD